MEEDHFNCDNQNEISDEICNSIKVILEEMGNPTELLNGRSKIIELLLPYNVSLDDVYVFDDSPDISVEEALELFDRYCEIMEKYIL